MIRYYCDICGQELAAEGGLCTDCKVWVETKRESLIKQAEHDLTNAVNMRKESYQKKLQKVD